jgi:ABC-type uncharacterized transport system substrate-binding protein
MAEGEGFFLLTSVAGALAAPLEAGAQQAGRVYRIAYLGNSSAALEAELVSAFREGLRDLNYVESRNVVIHYRWAERQYNRFPALVAEAVQLKVDVIVTAGTPAVLAAKGGTRTIPIVVAAMGDPIAAGVVPSLAHPGGNITGSASMSLEIDGKRLELLKEMVPGASRIAVLWNPTNPNNVARIAQMQEAARILRLTLEPLLAAVDAQELDRGFAAIVTARADALIMDGSRVARSPSPHRRVGRERSAPALYPYRELVQAGGPASYEPTYPAMFRGPPRTWTRFSRASGRRISPSSSRRRSSWSSTSRPPGRWASRSRRRCWRGRIK